MPRKKQIIEDSTMNVEGIVLRRSKRKPVGDNRTELKLDANAPTMNGSNVNKNIPLRKARLKSVKNNQKPINDQTINDQDHMIKSHRQSSKKLKTEDKSSFPDSKQNSPDSADSGISVKDECSSSTTSEGTSVMDGTSSNIKDAKTSKSLKLQRKRKVNDHIDSNNSFSKSKIKISEKKLSMNCISTELQYKESKILLNAHKKEKQILGENSSLDCNALCVAGSSMKREETILQVLAHHELDLQSECKIASPQSKTKSSDNDSSSESDWEEVEENKELTLEDYNPVIPKDGVEITIDCPELNVRKRKKKQFDHMEYIRLHINRQRKEHQLNLHKTHLLCLLAHGLFVNDILNSLDLKALALSYLPPDMIAKTAGRKIDRANCDVIQNIVSWFCELFSFENKQLPFLNFQESIPVYFQDRKSLSPSELNLMFTVFVRILGFKTRFCVSFYPVSYKAKNLLQKPGSKKKNSQDNQDKEKDISKKEKSISSVQKNSKTKSQMSANTIKTKCDVLTEKNTPHPRRAINKSYKMSSDEDEIHDPDFVMETKRMRVKRAARKSSVKSSNRKVLSSDSEPDSPANCSFKEDKIICWCEVFSKPDKKWISIECTNQIVDKPYDVERLLPQPVTYILAYDNDSYIKDLTKRYCNEYMTSTLKLRVDSDWWEETLEYFAPPNSKLNEEEEKKLDEILVNKPLPKTIGEYKNHPLYALKRHLLKFEAIFPPDAAPVGFIREEPVYARDNVCKLHSRETWVKEARVVKVGEEPYKVVKARPKWDRIAGVMRTDLPLEVFGFWQTQQYEPPVAEGGKVPRNEYGNVELFKLCMLPKGTVHLQIPGLNRVAKKLGIDCSPAVVGFDGHKGSIHPVFDGFVVCKEFKDTLLAAWDEEQVNAAKREEEKREKRIYGNWKKLIKGLLIRERIKLKYDVK